MMASLRPNCYRCFSRVFSPNWLQLAPLFASATASTIALRMRIWYTPVGVNQIRIRKAIGRRWRRRRGAASCGRIRWIRSPGKNSGDNLGEETPVIHFEQWEEDEIEVKLILKGGGCENKNIQYSVPCDAGPSGPRGPQSGRRAQVHPARGVAGAGAGLRAGRGGRVHRQRSRARVRTGEGAAVPHAGRCESESGAGEAGSARSWRRPTGWAWARWDSAARRR